MPTAAQQEPDQCPSTQAVDFSQDAIEPNNLFTREGVEAEINRRVELQLTEERRKGQRRKEERRAEEPPIGDKQPRHRKPANRHRNGNVPGEWRSDPTLPGSEQASRRSQLSTAASGYNHDLQSSLASTKLYTSRPAHNISRKTSGRPNGGVLPSTRTRVDTHLWYNERASRLERVSLQRRIPDRLLLTSTYGANGIFNVERVMTYLHSGVHGLYSGDVQIYSFA